MCSCSSVLVSMQQYGDFFHFLVHAISLHLCAFLIYNFKEYIFCYNPYFLLLTFVYVPWVISPIFSKFTLMTSLSIYPFQSFNLTPELSFISFSVSLSLLSLSPSVAAHGIVLHV